MDDLKLLTARWALPVSGPEIADAAVVLRAGKIKTICKREELSSLYSDTDLRELKWTSSDYGNAVIVPGLINLHAHLDYSLMHELYNENVESMFEWLPKLVNESFSWQPDKFKKSVLYGAEQSLAYGTTCIVDNSFTGLSTKLLAGIGMRAVVGLELFGQDETLADTAWQKWLEKYDSVRNDSDPLLQAAIKDGLINITVAPHSPYTVAPALWKKAAKWAENNKQKVLAHVAESTQECAWIRSGDESVDTYLRFVRELQVKAGIAAYKTAEAPPTPWRSKGRSPCQLLAEHDLLNERLVATHVVQVDEKDLRLLKVGKVRIVHCPRSNHHLKHGLAPLKQFKGLGLNIGLGSDSLASSPDLSMLNEAKEAMRLHAESIDPYEMTPEEALRMVTLRAAQVLGMQEKIGSLEKGKYADLSIFQYDETVVNTNPANTLFTEKAQAVSVYVQGRLLT